MVPQPVQQGGPPIWFAGRSESALKRAGEKGDGFISNWFTGAEGFRRDWATVAEHAETAGRDPATITRAALAYAYLDDDEARATALTFKALQARYGKSFPSLPVGALVGPPGKLIEAAQVYFEAGVDILIFGSFTADPAYFERLCQDVVLPLSTS